LPHRTGGDGDLFKSRPDRLDKYGHAPMAIDVGMYLASRSSGCFQRKLAAHEPPAKHCQRQVKTTLYKFGQTFHYFGQS
jgi:hypothetical protein